MKKTLLVFILVLLASGATYGATISGRVRVTGRAQRAKTITVVYAESLSGARMLPGTFSISQKNKTFSPSVLPVPVGSTVQFPNDDLVFHNVFSLSTPNPFDLGLYRAGATKSRVFQSPAIYRVFCNIHPQMTAVVLVVPTSYVAQTDAAGSYRMDLPDGRYRITAWSERSQPSSMEINVMGVSTTIGDLSLDESRFVEVAHKNKFGLDYPALAYDPQIDKRTK